MKLRYYLRGLGIGIFVTALILKLSSSGQGTMSDEEIMQRATELGMVTQKTLISQVQDEGEADASAEQVIIATEAPTTEPVAEATPEPVEETQDAAPTEEPADEPQVTEEPTPEPTVIPTEVPTQKPEVQVEDGEVVSLTIYSGDHSATVAKRMEELGLVEDYLDFDSYLCTNGYSRYVNSGIYKIQVGLSYEELAKIITRTN